MSIPKAVGDALREIGETPATSGWDCHGTFVLLHKTLERLAVFKGVTFDPPLIVESNSAAKSAVIVVTGHIKTLSGAQTEWSFGEAAPHNNKNAYPFAMAEKRAKDRVILKLVGLHGHVYSEEEADDFKASRPAHIKDTPTTGGPDLQTEEQMREHLAASAKVFEAERERQLNPTVENYEPLHADENEEEDKWYD